MLDIKKKPYNLFLIAALSLFASSFLVAALFVKLRASDAALNMGIAFSFWMASTLSFLFWLLYKLTNRLLLSTAFTWIHVAFTLLTIIVFSLKLRIDSTVEKSFEVVIYVLCFAQVMFPVNLIGGIIKYVNTRRK